MGNVFPYYFLDEEAKPFRPKAIFHPRGFDWRADAEEPTDARKAATRIFNASRRFDVDHLFSKKRDSVEEEANDVRLA